MTKRASLGKASKSKETPKAPKIGKAGKQPLKLYSNFLPLPISLPAPIPIASSSKTKAPSAVTHYLFVRPHTTKAGDEDEIARAARTLFVANVPVDAGVRDLRSLFGRWGVVEDVDLTESGKGGDVLEAAVRGLPVDSDSEDDEEGGVEGDEETEGADQSAEPTFMGTGEKLPRSRRQRRKPNTLPPSVPEVAPLHTATGGRETPYGPSGTRCAHIIFVDAVSVQRAMSHTGEPIAIAPYGEPTGLSYYEAQYAALRPPLSVVRAHADTAMARYDHLHSLLLSSRAKQQGAGALVDEDGFTIVVRGGRYGRTAGRAGDPGGAGVAVASRGAPAPKKKESRGAGELKDFYKFQVVDRKRKELAQMRARFEDDKRKVEDLKKSRRFKPY